MINYIEKTLKNDNQLQGLINSFTIKEVVKFTCLAYEHYGNTVAKELVGLVEIWLKTDIFTEEARHNRWALFSLVTNEKYRFSIVSQLIIDHNFGVYCNIAKSFTAKSTYKNKLWNNFIND